MKDKKQPLTRAQVDQLLAPGDDVHTFVPAGFGLIGAHWEREHILRVAEEGGAELAGESAAAMKHGLAVWDGPNNPVFCETCPKALARFCAALRLEGGDQ